MHIRRDPPLAGPAASPARSCSPRCGGDDDDRHDAERRRRPRRPPPRRPARPPAATRPRPPRRRAATDDDRGRRDDRRRPTAPAAAAATSTSPAGCPDDRRHPDRLEPRGRARLAVPVVGDDYDDRQGRRRGDRPARRAGGVDTGVDIEIRSGGPAIGFQTVTSQLYTDDDILLGYVYTDEAIQNSAEFPTVAVMAGHGEEPADDHVGPGDVPRRRDDRRPRRGRHPRPLLRWRGLHGLLHPDRASSRPTRSTAATTARRPTSSPPRARTPSRASARPSRTSTRTRSPDWGKPVAYQYINDAGWENYAESIATQAGEPRDVRRLLRRSSCRSSSSRRVDYLDRPGRDERADPRGRRDVRQRLGVHARASPTTPSRR